MRRFFRIGIPVLVLICLVSGGVFLVTQKKNELSRVSAYGVRPRPVTVVKAEKGDLVLEKEYLAVVEPVREARISARVTAAVEKIPVDEGDRVAGGQILAELDGREVRFRMDAAAFRIEQAEAELAGNQATIRALAESHDYRQDEKKRALALLEKEMISDTEAQLAVEKAADVQGKLRAAQQKSRAIERQIDALRSQKAEIAARYGDYTLNSPFAGMVTRRMADPGDMATPSMHLLTVQDLSTLKLAFDVPQKDLPGITKGLAVAFSVNGIHRNAEISAMHPALDKAKMMRAEAWVEYDVAAGLSPGAYLPVTVGVEKIEDVILVPASALIKGPQGKGYVFALDGDEITAKPVDVLGRTADTVAVRGLEADTRVLENTFLGWATLSSGQKVEVVQ